MIRTQSYSVDVTSVQQTTEEEHCILVVGTESSTCGVVTHFLRQEKYNVVSIAGGFESLSALKASTMTGHESELPVTPFVTDDGRRVSPSLCLVSMRTTNLGGIEVMRDIFSDPKTRNIPVIIMTISDADDVISKAYVNGASAVIVAPVQTHILSATVKTALIQSRLRKRLKAAEAENFQLNAQIQRLNIELLEIKKENERKLAQPKRTPKLVRSSTMAAIKNEREKETDALRALTLDLRTDLNKATRLNYTLEREIDTKDKIIEELSARNTTLARRVFSLTNEEKKYDPSHAAQVASQSHVDEASNETLAESFETPIEHIARTAATLSNMLTVSNDGQSDINIAKLHESLVETLRALQNNTVYQPAFSKLFETTSLDTGTKEWLLGEYSKTQRPAKKHAMRDTKDSSSSTQISPVSSPKRQPIQLTPHDNSQTTPMAALLGISSSSTSSGAVQSPLSSSVDVAASPLITPPDIVTSPVTSISQAESDEFYFETPNKSTPMSMLSNPFIHGDDMRHTPTHDAPSHTLSRSSKDHSFKSTISLPMPDFKTALNDWDYDPLEVDENVLEGIFEAMFKSFDLLTIFGIEEPVLRRFIHEVRLRYRSNRFHTFRHAFDVAHSCYMLLKHTRLKDVIMDPLDQLALLIAALCHDVEHPGTNNAFEKNIHSALATTYNDGSILENHSCATAFRLLRNPEIGANVLDGLTKDEHEHVRQRIISAILGTDMKNHFELASKLNALKAHPLTNDESEQEMDLIIQIILHVCDISNPCKPLQQACQWSERAVSEFFAQGDKEREMGLTVSGGCDRNSLTEAKVACNFIDFIVGPIVKSLQELVPELDRWVHHCKENGLWWMRYGEDNTIPMIVEAAYPRDMDSLVTQPPPPPPMKTPTKTSTPVMRHATPKRSTTTPSRINLGFEEEGVFEPLVPEKSASKAKRRSNKPMTPRHSLSGAEDLTVMSTTMANKPAPEPPKTETQSTPVARRRLKSNRSDDARPSLRLSTGSQPASPISKPVLTPQQSRARTGGVVIYGHQQERFMVQKKSR